jgi:hypothetical protein
MTTEVATDATTASDCIYTLLALYSDGHPGGRRTWVEKGSEISWRNSLAVLEVLACRGRISSTGLASLLTGVAMIGVCV